MLQGELDLFVNGASHVLAARSQPGMVGIVCEPDRVVHRTNSDGDVRVLVIWPFGGEAAGFDASGMRLTALAPAR